MADSGPRSTPPGREHVLKCWLPFFEVVMYGEKTFEVRKNDRGFQRGDTLLLREWDPDANYGSGRYTGREGLKVVTYVLGGFAGIEDGYVVMGLRDV